ncbi:unnamed protein product [Ceutorhynchus assimilis]|uniref:3-dehydrosphinganine reductase n=1 Tax=Ceutorhynchus assimilis TaxID=467358 RepID=A0A9N9QJT1_9CUCU|nr:unnamed protein product [Ceutorhynchus assimilis]
MFYISIVVVLIFIVVVLKFLTKPSPKSLKSRHVVITGGSSGIGKAVAVLAARKGANVTIIARNIEKLEAAKKEIESQTANQIVTTISVDVSDKEAIEEKILEIEKSVGPVFMLVNCAGLAICGKLEEMTKKDINQLINVNLLGTIYPIQALLPRFKERQEGIVVLTGSVVSLMGLFGYSIYSSCKFALRGLAESLYQELKLYNVSVTLALPPDTDTPGFETENKSKPKETKLLSESGGLLAPEAVAQKLMDDALRGHFFSHVGLEGFIVTTLCIGMSPFCSLVDVAIEATLLGPLRLIAAFYVKHFEGIIFKCSMEKKNNQKKEE